jgi:hypothetical protein
MTSRIMLVCGLLGLLCACSSDGGGGAGPAASSTSTTDKPPPAPPPQANPPPGPPPGDAGNDAPEVVDKTPVLTFVRDGATQTVLPNTTKVEKNSDGSYSVKASFDPPFPRSPPLDPGAAWLTVNVKNKGATSCAKDAYVDLLYQEPNGTITSADASVASGSCTMQVKRFGDDGLFEGSATGFLANSNFSRNWSFSVTWRQPTP